MRKLFNCCLIILCVLFLIACTTNTPAGYDDARIVYEQRLIIEQQREELANLERIINEVRSDLGNARILLTGAIEESGSIREQWEIIKPFVDSIIRTEQKLADLQ